MPKVLRADFPSGFFFATHFFPGITILYFSPLSLIFFGATAFQALYRLLGANPVDLTRGAGLNPRRKCHIDNYRDDAQRR